MPGRAITLITGELYHLYNRGNEKRIIFLGSRDFKRFLLTLFYYQFLGPKTSFSKFSKQKLIQLNTVGAKKLVEIICYCLMPNHFHLLIRQLQDRGVSTYLSQVSNSYTKYFNTKYKRVGALFQGAFKAVRVETDEQFIHLSRYIHLNPVVSGIAEKLDDYQWSSYKEYINGETFICSTSEILNYFPSSEEYKIFLEDQFEYGKTLELLKHKIIE